MTLFARLFLLIPLVIFPIVHFPYTVPKIAIFLLLFSVFFTYTLWKHFDAFVANLKKPFSLLLLAFLLIQILSATFGENPSESFIGSFLRFDGVATSVALVLFFFCLSVIRDHASWIKILSFSVYVSIVIAAFSFLQAIQGIPVYATLGNPAFVGQYLLIHFFLALFLFYQTPDRKKYFWLIPLFLQFSAILTTGIRGVFLALAAGIFLLAVFFFVQAFFSDERQKKKLHASLLGSFLGLTILFGILLLTGFFQHFSFVQNSPALRHLADFSLTSDTIQTRLWNWNIAWQGFLEKPFLGWGAENFDLVFSKYYDPRFFRYSPAEIWFDKAHNHFLDVLISNGAIGLTLFLSLLAIIFWRIRKNPFFLALFAAFLVQSFFDVMHFVIFLLFFIFVAAFFALSSRNDSFASERHFFQKNSFIKKTALGFSAVFSVFVLLSTLLYTSAFLSFDRALASISPKEISLDPLVKKFETGSKLSSFFPALRFHYLREILFQFLQNPPYNKQDLHQKIFPHLEKEFEKLLPLYQNDVAFHLNLARLYKAWSKFDSSKIPQARASYEKALSFHPSRQQILIALANFESELGNHDRALSLDRQAVSADPVASHPHWALGTVLIAAGQDSEAVKEIESALFSGFRPTSIKEISAVLGFLREQKSLQSLTVLGEIFLRLDPRNILFRQYLAAVYKELGNKEKAREHLFIILKMAPQAGPAIEKQLQSL